MDYKKDNYACSYTEIAERLNLTRNQVIAIERKAIKKIRIIANKSNKLQDYNDVWKVFELLLMNKGGKKMIFEHMDRIVFAGDSVTDMESAQPVGEGLFENVGKSYVRIVENMLAAFYPEIYLRVTNSGISGNTSRDLLDRKSVV